MRYATVMLLVRLNPSVYEKRSMPAPPFLVVRREANRQRTRRVWRLYTSAISATDQKVLENAKKMVMKNREGRQVVLRLEREVKRLRRIAGKAKRAKKAESTENRLTERAVERGEVWMQKRRARTM
jgi:hypothetical protein